MARDAGVALIPSTEVTGLHRDASVVTALATDGGNIPARHVVIAAGAWSGGFADALDERLPVVGARGLSLTVDRPSTGPRRAMLLGEKHVAVAPYRDELRMSGWFELGTWSLTPEPRRIERIEALARSRLDFDATLTNPRSWAGLRPMTPDGVPIIGPSRRWSNVTIATGHAMTGLSMGLGTGRLVAQLVDGEPTDIDVARFAPERFA
jgi:D-amino-acid dehydrogenase